MRSAIIFCLLILCFAKALLSQTDTIKSKTVKYTVLPIALRSPETSWAFGASSSITFKTKNDSLTRTSNLLLAGIYSLRQQLVLSVDASVFFPKEDYILFFQSSYSMFPDKFWGIGNSTLNTDQESYSFNQYLVYPHLKKRIYNRFFLGGLYQYQRLYNVTYQAGGAFDQQDVLGRYGYDISGAGLSLSYDSRNNSFYPTKGLFSQVFFKVFNKTIGSTYNYTNWVIDVRYFKSLAPKHIIATQFYSYFNTTKAAIRNLAPLGGGNNLRGYYLGRYRDNAMMSVIAEYRATIYKRIGAVVFGGLGKVASKVEYLDMRDLKYSYGAGLRIAVFKKEKLNIRIDYGYADKYNQGLYFTVGEAF